MAARLGHIERMNTIRPMIERMVDREAGQTRPAQKNILPGVFENQRVKAGLVPVFSGTCVLLSNIGHEFAKNVAMKVDSSFGSALKRATVFLALGFLVAQVSSSLAAVVPADRLGNWQGTVGVPGGIPNRTTIYQTLSPGATADQIASAINNCPAGQVVYLNAGTYNLSSQIRVLNKSDWTLRGAGQGKTILKTSAWAALLNLGQFPWITEWPADTSITGGGTKGSTSITVASTAGITANNLIFLEEDNVSDDVFGFGSGSANSAGRLRDGNKVQAQMVYVTGVSGSTLTFTPPLNFDFPSGRNPRAVNFNGKSGPKFSGVEDLTIAGSTGGYGIWWQGAYACWMKNVEVTSWDTFGVEIQYSVNMEVRDGFIHDPAVFNWSKGYSLQFDTANNCLVENNLFYKFQDGVLLQGSCAGNVIAYNCLFRSYPAYNGVDIMLASMFGNHTPYPTHNLYEGNFAGGFHVDYYYGPSAKGTLLRNYYHAGDPETLQNRIAVNIDSHQWDYNIIGNILGSSGTSSPIYSALVGTTVSWVNTTPVSWTHGATSTDNFAYTAPRLYRLGYPYIGNNSSSGTANPPTSGNLGAMDMSVKPGGAHQALLHGNWEYTTKSVVYNSSVPDTTIPNSYYLASKPAWFGNLKWPPYDPANGGSMTPMSLTNLPAGYRFVYGVNPPSGPTSGNQAPTAVATATTSTTGVVPLAVTFSSSGSSDPEGTALSYSWNFGDGSTSTVANPSHSYTSAGSYVVRLTVSDGTNSSLSGAINVTVTAPVNLAPIAAVNASPKVGVMPLLVTFTSAGTSDPEGSTLTYSWTFGDGGTSTAANPTHTYSTASNFTAKLTVSDGTNSTTSSNLVINVSAVATNYPPSPVANATPSSGSAPLAVTFSSAGSADPEGSTLSYNWNFGDGTSSTAASPSHTYSTNGNYAAQLTISDGTTSVSAASITISVADAASGLVAAYSFDEGSGITTTDVSGKTNTGTISNATWTAAGKYGGALTFNGTDALVVVPPSTSLNVTNAMTQEAWVYPTASKAGWSTVMHRQTDAYYLHASSPDGAMRPAGGAIFGGTESYVAGVSAIPLNTWTHLAATYDGATLKVYVNGILSSSKTVSGAVQSNANPLRIGGNYPYGQFFEGSIDEVRVYNRALSQGEIQTSMNTALPSVTSPPVPTAPAAPQNLRVVANP